MTDVFALKTRLDELLSDIRRVKGERQLRHLRELLGEGIRAPSGVVFAIQSERAELMKLVKPESLDMEGIQCCLNVIETFIETHRALREHVEQVSEFLEDARDIYGNVLDAPYRASIDALARIKPVLAELHRFASLENET